MSRNKFVFIVNHEMNSCFFKALYRCNYEVLPAEGDKAATAVFTAVLITTNKNSTTTTTN